MTNNTTSASKLAISNDYNLLPWQYMSDGNAQYNDTLTSQSCKILTI